MRSSHQQKIIKIIMSIMVLSMSILFPSQILANNQGGATGSQAGTTAQSGTPVKPVHKGDLGREISLSSGVNMVLKELYLIPGESGQIAYINLEIKNNSGQPFDFYPYWLRVQSKVGERFKVKYVDEQRSSKIFPHSTRSFAYFAELPHRFTKEDLQVQMIKWDFSTANYERLVHTFSLPQELSTGVVPVGEKGQIEVQGVPISIEITNARVAEGATRKTGNFTISLVNEGHRAVKLPAFQFSLQGNGFSYPADLKATEEGIELLPNVEKKQTIRVPMSVDAKIAEYHLVVAEPQKDAEPAFSVPKTSFAFKIAEGQVGGVAVGETTTILYGNHDFDLRVENVQLLPSTSLDNMLSYDVYLTNKNNSRVALPELASYVHVKNESPELAKPKEEEKKELFPEEELKLTMFAAVPEKANLNDLMITFESTLGANPNGEEALEEVYAAYNVSIGNVRRDGTKVADAHHFSDLGDKSTIKPYQTTTYETNSSKLLVSQFIVENKEQKPILVPEYKGYFKSATGAIFPVQYKSKAGEIINANGSAVITYWAEVSKNLNLNDMQLVLGIPINKESEAISEAASFQVLGSNTPARRSTAYPVDYYISSVRASASLREELNRVSMDDDDSVGLGYMREIGSVSLEYTLRKDYKDNVLADGYERTLTFELLDSNGSVRDRREGVSLDKEVLSGKNMISLSANVPLYEVLSLRVKVYENFEHGRQLIGTYSIGL